jgi:hypothetical protein
MTTKKQAAKKPKLQTLKYFDWFEVVHFLQEKGWEGDDSQLLGELEAHNDSYIDYEVGQGNTDLFLEFDRALVNHLGLKLGQQIAFWICW